MKKLVGFAFVLFLIVSFAFAASSNATLNISAYKNQSNLPSDGTIKVYIYDARESSSSSTEISGDLDISSYVKNTSGNYIDALKDIFSIKIQSNLNKEVNIAVTFSPFINSTDSSDIIPTTYYLKLNDGTYTSKQKVSGGSDSYYYNYATTLEPKSDSTNFTGSSGYTVGSGGKAEKKTASIDLQVTTMQRKKNKNNSWNDFKTSYEVLPGMNYETTSWSATTTYNYTIESTIKVQMKLVPTESQKTAHSNTNGITPNVQYVAPVTIMVTIE